jgi:hypothetical protein
MAAIQTEWYGKLANMITHFMPNMVSLARAQVLQILIENVHHDLKIFKFLPWPLGWRARYTEQVNSR